MTNREKLAQMSNQELGEFICRQHTMCVNCIGQDMCGVNATGAIAWLEDEAEEDNDRQINPCDPDCPCLSAVTADCD